METERDKRQKEAIEAWKKKGLRGTIDGCVGFGKTVMTINWVIKPAFEKIPNLKCAIIVPNNELVKQWREKTNEYPIDIRTVHSFINKPEEHWDLIIYDEIHRYIKGKKFSKVLDYPSKWKLGLSGSLTDETRERLQSIGLPVVDVIPLDYSIQKKWNNDFVEYNLKIFMTKEESERMKEIENTYYKIISYLGKGEINYEILRKILVKEFIGYKKEKGQIVTYKTGKKKGLPIPIYRYPYAEEIAKELKNSVSFVTSLAIRAIALIRKRKKFFYNYKGKIKAIQEIIKRFSHRKIIVFTIEQDFCDRAALSCNSKSYHGNIPEKEKERIIKEFKESKNGSLFTCLSINEGINIPDLDFCINASYYSTEELNKQRQGRVVRLNSSGRKAIIVNLVTCYHPSVKGITQEERWLIKFQKNAKSKPITITSYDEIREE